MSAQPTAQPSLSRLPTVLTPLLGRESELDHLQGLVDTPSTRLITLTGPAGVGKSRLALHLATTLMKEFNRDVVFVPLASIRDPSLFLPTIGQALGLPADASETIVERVATTLEERQAFLVLDNFEQLLDATPGVVALLAHSSGTTVLITRPHWALPVSNSIRFSPCRLRR
ncbi:MAG: AAA family ATPase [Chloroflexota bacterium]|nr:AAA family ATPase [Chloroflexota bacterium]